MDINFNLYRQFYKVANSRSLGDVAEKYITTAAALSRDIKKLESQLNVKLFHREKTGMRLTKEGEELYKHIADAISSIELGEKIIEANNDFSKSKITIGCPSHVSSFYLSEIIEKLKKDYPSIMVKKELYILA